MTLQLHKFAGAEELSAGATEQLLAIAQASLDARGIFHLALSGGSTPKRMFQMLAERGRQALDWNRVELWWSDERTVPPDHPDSNYRMTKEALIEPLGLEALRVHRMRGEDRDPVAAARDYEQDVLHVMGAPVFDLILLGMGPDGHTASLFPGTPALDETMRLVVANPVDSPLTKGATTRLTMTAKTINAARQVRFLIAGADKAPALAAVLQGPRDPHRYPAQLIAPTSGELRWLVDQAAAARLEGSS